jgi:hypothetical protein
MMMMTTMILLHLQYEVDDVVEEDGYDHYMTPSNEIEQTLTNPNQGRSIELAGSCSVGINIIIIEDDT